MSHRTDILLRSGNFYDFMAPETSIFLIDDVAHGLANECRFGGQTRVFYSVAQHSVLVSYLVEPEYQLAAMLHDAAEFVLKDIMKPLKRLLPDYQALEARHERIILGRFGITLPLHPSIKVADMIMLATEKRDLMPSHEYDDCAGAEPLGEVIVPLAPYLAKRAFLRRYYELTSARAAA